MTNKKSLNKKNGFGIIEVLVSISMMALVLVALVSLSSATFVAWDNAKNRTIAQGILQDVIESIHNKRDTNVSSGLAWDDGIVDISPEEVDINNKTFTKKVTITDISSSFAVGEGRVVETVISWIGRGTLQVSDIKSITYITDWRSGY